MVSTTSMHSVPVSVTNEGVVVPLSRVGIAEGRHREKFIQDLVHDQPSVIPMLDIEPAFHPLISVCRELETPRGFLDNLWVTPDGALVLGECKLFRNPQARREVVAQALDYAAAISSWRLEDLEREAGKALGQTGFRLWNLVSGQTDLDEAQFNDAVERRLKRGRVLVLIVGDGITEGAEALTTYLQLHAGFHAGLALVDLSVWEMGDGSRIVVPRVPMRTVLVERAIVRLDTTGAPVIGPTEDATEPQPQDASEEEFFEQLRTRRPQLVAGLREFAASLPQVGIIPEFRKSLVLRWMPTPDVRGSAGYVDSYGTVWLGDAKGTAARLGVEAAGINYLESVAAIVNGSVKLQPSVGVVTSSGRTVHLSDLLPVQDKWLAALHEFVSALAEASKAGEANPT